MQCVSHNIFFFLKINNEVNNINYNSSQIYKKKKKKKKKKDNLTFPNDTYNPKIII